MGTIFGLVLKTQVTRGRAAALAAVALLGLALAVAVSRVDGFRRMDAAYDLVEAYGLNLLVPLTALVFAAAALGDPVEDGTLVYLWHRPISRLRIVLGALAGAICIVVPFAVVPTVAAAALTGAGGRLVAGAAAASLLAAAAYSTLFLGLGLIVRRALAWGLAYVLIWEGFVARSGLGPARLSIIVYARTILAEVSGHEPPRLAASTTVAVLAPLVAGAVAVAVTTQVLRRIDVR